MIINFEEFKKIELVVARIITAEKIEGSEKCELFIAETDKIAVYDYDAEKLKALNKRKIIDLPGGGNHFTRTIIFMPA